MTDITSIPTAELQQDLRETRADIELCTTALAMGVTEYSGGTVNYRLDANAKIEKRIVEELTRRGVEID